ncbi:MAG: hypothetical protein K2I63_03660 [Helicobacter sp.]|nr:hypothetical protein [Helicobacter sp.]
MADSDEIMGQISAVDDINKTITLNVHGNEMIIQVFPHTKIKGDDCGTFGSDVYGTFKDLTIGKFVEVEVTPYGNHANPSTSSQKGTHFGAKEIEWKCNSKKKAY